MPFTFVFNGSFVDLYKLLNQLEGFTVQTPGGTLHVNGRLLTIDTSTSRPTQRRPPSPVGKAQATELTGTINATAYVLAHRRLDACWRNSRSGRRPRTDRRPPAPADRPRAPAVVAKAP